MHDAQHNSDAPLAGGLTIGVVTSRWHASITSMLLGGAQRAHASADGVPDALVHVEVPGAWELPVVAAALLRRDDIDGVVVLGCVIKGETAHDHWINMGVSSALADLAVRTGKPATLGVLTCDTIEQAQARAGGVKGNKGHDAMAACIDTIRTLEQVGTDVEVR